MTQHIDVYSTNSTISLPSNLVSANLAVTAIGAGYEVTGQGAFVSGSIAPSAFPLTAIIGGEPIVSGSTRDGGPGYSGGGASSSAFGGGGSTGVLSGSTLLIEAGGQDGVISGIPGGSGGGYASNTPPNGGGGIDGAGSGGSQGGSGGTAPNPSGGTFSGGTGNGGGTNGNAASGATSGAGVGSGGLTVPGCAASFAASSVIGYQYGQGPQNSGSGPGSVVVVYDVADAPSMPTNLVPAAGSYADTNADGITLAALYQTPGSDTGDLVGVAVSLKIDGGTVHYWNGTNFSSTTPVYILPSTGIGAVNGERFTVVIPAGVLADGHTYTWGLSCQESFANLEGAFSATQNLIGAVAPSAVITAPVSTVGTLTPTVMWTPTTPAGSQTNYQCAIYDAPTASPGSGSPLVDQVGTTATSFMVGSGILDSVETYYGYLQIVETGGQTSPWVPFVFTVQLVDPVTPTMSALATTEPVSGCPAPLLEATFAASAVPTGIAFAKPTLIGAPPGRNDAGTCLHPNGLSYIYGGNLASGQDNTTWSYNPVTDTYTQIVTANNPGSIADFTMGYDPVSGKIIGFGGYNGTSSNANTWELDPTATTPNWVQLTPSASPAARSEHSMFMHPVNGQLCIYGGNNANTPKDDLWTWTGTTWSELSTALTGTARTAQQAVTYGNEVLINGGKTASAGLTDTWLWNGTTATAQSPATVPPNRGYAGIAYNPTTNQVIMVGGGNFANTILSDVWVWNGNDWTLITPTGTAMGGWAAGRILWHPGLGQLVQLCGFSSTAGAVVSTVWNINFGPTITHVQTNRAAGTNQATVTITPRAVGHLVTVKLAIVDTSSATVTGITDSGLGVGGASAVWSKDDAEPFDSGVYGRCEHWSATIEGGLGTSQTATLAYSATPGTTTEIIIDEWSSGLGPFTVWTLVSAAVAASTSNVTTATFPSVSTNATQELYEGFAFCSSGSAGSTAGFTYNVTAFDNVVAFNTSCPASTAEQPTAPMSSGKYSSVAAVFSASVSNLNPEVEFQASYDGGITWADILGLVEGETATTAMVTPVASLASVYDMGAPFNVPLQYRCRLIAVSGGQTYVSAWSSVVTHLIEGDDLTSIASLYWWMVPPSDPSMAIQLKRIRSTVATSSASTSDTAVTMPAIPAGLSASLIVDEPEQQGRFNGFGSPTALVIHGDIWAEEFVLNVYFDGEADFQAFRAIRNLQQAVLLKSDMSGELYWVTLGPARPTAILSEAGRQSDPKRGLSVQCIPAPAYAT